MMKNDDPPIHGNQMYSCNFQVVTKGSQAGHGVFGHNKHRSIEASLRCFVAGIHFGQPTARRSG